MPIISIHTLRVEGDAGTSITTFAVVIFLSTPSGWRATHLLEFLKHFVKISIHTLRVEGDVESDDIRTDQLISIHTLRVEGDSPRTVIG